MGAPFYIPPHSDVERDTPVRVEPCNNVVIFFDFATFVANHSDVMISRLLYVLDPLCGWCYAAGPLVREAHERFARQMSIELHPGLLFSPGHLIDGPLRNHIASSDQRIGSLAGVPFGDAYLRRLHEEPELSFDSVPPTLALLAVGELAPARTLDMLESLQRAHYVDGRNLSDELVLSELAQSLSIAPEDFAAARRAAQPTLSQRTTRARAIMQAAGGQGFPTFVLEVGNRRVRLDHASAYGQPSLFADRLGQALDAYAPH